MVITIDDCDSYNVTSFTINVNDHYVVVSIKLEEYRSRSAKACEMLWL